MWQEGGLCEGGAMVRGGRAGQTGGGSGWTCKGDLAMMGGRSARG